MGRIATIALVVSLSANAALALWCFQLLDANRAQWESIVDLRGEVRGVQDEQNDANERMERAVGLIVTHAGKEGRRIDTLETCVRVLDDRLEFGSSIRRCSLTFP